MENRIEQLRKENNMTQQELANALKVSRQTIISLETGRYNPSLTLAFEISRKFNKSIEEVFLYEGK